MPTGYTCKVQNGEIDNAKDFLMLCARAFGATVEMRDKSLDIPIPEFKPSSTYLDWTNREKKELEKYKSMTIEEAQKEIDKEFKENIDHDKEYVNKYNDTRRKYEKVLDEVKQWQPPTKDHINLKKYAIKQLEDSIEWDCSIDYLEQDLKKEKPNAEKWLQDRIEGCIKDIKRYEEDYANEVKRTEENNKWIRDLRESFE